MNKVPMTVTGYKNLQNELNKLINQSTVIDETRDEINRLVDTSVLAINNCFSSESATQLCALANQLKQPF